MAEPQLRTLEVHSMNSALFLLFPEQRLKKLQSCGDGLFTVIILSFQKYL